MQNYDIQQAVLIIRAYFIVIYKPS